METNGFSSLVNLGNTCYLNSALQILSHIYELNQYIDQHKTVNNCDDSVITRELYDLFKLMWANNCTISPNKFVHYVRELSKVKNNIFHDNYQHDSVEYFSFCIECLHTSYNLLDNTTLPKTIYENVNSAIDLYESKNKSIVHNLFTSFLLVIYSNVNNKVVEFEKIEPNFTIELSIPNLPHPTLYDCFEETFKIEVMTDRWLDDKSGIMKHLSKQTYLCYLPHILVIHLKRWDYQFNKNYNKVTFDETINIHKYTKYIDEDTCNYQLFGVINHQGNVQNGHYSSYIKKKDWFSFDDTTITKIDTNQLNDQQNYCLFYRKIK